MIDPFPIVPTLYAWDPHSPRDKKFARIGEENFSLLLLKRFSGQSRMDRYTYEDRFGLNKTINIFSISWKMWFGRPQKDKGGLLPYTALLVLVVGCRTDSMHAFKNTCCIYATHIAQLCSVLWAAKGIWWIYGFISTNVCKLEMTSSTHSGRRTLTHKKFLTISWISK